VFSSCFCCFRRSGNTRLSFPLHLFLVHCASFCLALRTFFDKVLVLQADQRYPPRTARFTCAKRTITLNHERLFVLLFFDLVNKILQVKNSLLSLCESVNTSVIRPSGFAPRGLSPTTSPFDDAVQSFQFPPPPSFFFYLVWKDHSATSSLSDVASIDSFPSS